MNVIMGIIKECRDEVCNLAATTVQLLVDVLSIILSYIEWI